MSLVVQGLGIWGFHCQRSGFDPWLGHQGPTSICAAQMKRERGNRDGGQLGGRGHNSGSSEGRKKWSIWDIL